MSALTLAGCGLDRSGLDLDPGQTPVETGAGGGTGSGGQGVGGMIGAGLGGATGAGGKTNAGGGTGGGSSPGGGGAAGSGGATGVGGATGLGGLGAGGTTGVGGSTGVGGATSGVGGTNGVGGTTGVGGMMVGGTGGIAGAGGPGGPCTATSCPNGCCAGTTCVTPMTAQQCGHPGAQCQPCMVCDRCSATGACELDPESHWDFAAISASVAPTDPNAADGVWDVLNEPIVGPDPDPFCELDLHPPEVTGQAPTIANTLLPNWSAAVAPKLPLLHPVAAPIRAGDLMLGGAPWTITIGDDDSGSILPSGEPICQFGGPLDASVFHAGGFTRTNLGACLSAKFTLTCHR